MAPSSHLVERHSAPPRRGRRRKKHQRLMITSSTGIRALERWPGHGVDGQRHVDGVQVDHGDVERQAAHHVEVDLQQGVLLGLGRLRVADHKERADRGDLPAGEDPVQCCRRGRWTNIADRKRNMSARNLLRRSCGSRPSRACGRVLMMLDKILHVAQGVHADDAAHDADDEHHDDRQVVDVHGGHACAPPAPSPKTRTR